VPPATRQPCPRRHLPGDCSRCATPHDNYRLHKLWPPRCDRVARHLRHPVETSPRGFASLHNLCRSLRNRKDFATSSHERPVGMEPIRYHVASAAATSCQHYELPLKHDSVNAISSADLIGPDEATILNQRRCLYA
jgi:hypothetical protein